MKILFVKGHTLFSSSICWVAKEPISHVAIQLGEFVFHSNLLGVHIETAKRFTATCDVIYYLEAPEGTPQMLLQAIDLYDGDVYDFGAFIFLGICLWLNRRFNVPMPKRNLWSDRNAFLCTEWATAVINHKADSMITPFGLYLELKEKWSQPQEANNGKTEENIPPNP